MTTIPSQLSSPAASFAGLAAQTQPAPDRSVPGADVLTLSGSAPDDDGRIDTGRQIERQNRLAVLSDASAAFAATARARTALRADPGAALAAQANLNPSSVLSLVQEG